MPNNDYALKIIQLELEKQEIVNTVRYIILSQYFIVIQQPIMSDLISIFLLQLLVWNMWLCC